MEKTISIIGGLISICCIAFSIGIYANVKETDSNKLRDEIRDIEIQMQTFTKKYLALPVGTIIGWNPLLVDENGNNQYRNLPEGWAICNGKNNTPNLNEVFLMGVVSIKDVGGVGGNNTSQPAGNHTHRFTVREGGGSKTSSGFQKSGSNCQTATHDTTPSEAHSHGDNRPSYYSVLYIIKTK